MLLLRSTNNYELNAICIWSHCWNTGKALWDNIALKLQTYYKQHRHQIVYFCAVAISSKSLVHLIEPGLRTGSFLHISDPYQELMILSLHSKLQKFLTHLLHTRPHNQILSPEFQNYIRSKDKTLLCISGPFQELLILFQALESEISNPFAPQNKIFSEKHIRNC